MKLCPSDLPQRNDATSLSKPGFDILLAVSRARQTALPTVRMLKQRQEVEAHRATLNALRKILSGATVIKDQNAMPPTRFLNLSYEANALPETMNRLFTRGFQRMLNPYEINRGTSANPIPHRR